MAFLIFILFLDVLTPEMVLPLEILSILLTASFGLMVQRQLKRKFGEQYTTWLTILSAIIAIIGAIAFGYFVALTTAS
jgi:hypothetical protein